MGASKLVNLLAPRLCAPEHSVLGKRYRFPQSRSLAGLACPQKPTIRGAGSEMLGQGARYSFPTLGLLCYLRHFLCPIGSRHSLSLVPFRKIDTAPSRINSRLHSKHSARTLIGNTLEQG